MKHQEIREKFLKYFESKGHAVVPSSSLLPTDPSVLFTTAGMQQFKPYYTGASDAMKDFGSLNTVSIQKSMRTSDIDEVGDESHLTFFEMLGNFSFGGYWKKEAIEYAHEFITKEMGLTIDYVSVFAGEDDIPADEESEKIWHSINPNIEVRKFGKSDNFWGPTGNEGPCGPTTEIYVRGLEVWNIVFNQYYYIKQEKVLNSNRRAILEKLEPLKIQGIDTGMGLERLAMVVQGKNNVFETDLFDSFRIILRGGEEDIKSGRIIADHIRASIFLASDGLTPSNKEQGYILRRLIRRAMIHANKAELRDNILLLSNNILIKLINDTINLYTDLYPELISKKVEILNIIEKEMNNFGQTLRKGLREFHRRFPGMQAQEMKPGIEIKPFIIGQEIGKEAFDIYQSYGFPIEVIKELLEDRWYRFDERLFRQAIEEEKNKHQEISRAGAEKKFGGHGMKEGDLTAADAEEMKKKTRLHTATHVIVAALQKVLGQKLPQAGSDITAERLRFDFTFPRKITPEELKEAENIANKIVDKDLPVTMEELDLQEALDSGASAFFKLKYPPRVKVYSIGEPGNYFSRELCGGPHVLRTSEIGKITITKEESVSGGRRIRAVVD